jgi:hypothetical protein
VGLGRVEIVLGEIPVRFFGFLVTARVDVDQPATVREQLLPEIGIAPVHAALHGNAPLGHHPVQREQRRAQHETLAARGDGPRRRVEMERERRQRLLRFGDGFGEPRAPLQQALGQPVAQSDEGNVAQMHARLPRVEFPTVTVADQARMRGGIEKFRTRLEGRRYQHMRQPILRPPEQRQGITDIKPHRLAPAGDRDVQARICVLGKRAHLFGDEIGDGGVVPLRENVVERLTVRCGDDVNVVLGEGDRRQAVIGAQPMEPAGILGQQGVPRLLGAAPRRDQADPGRHPGGLPVDRERVERLGDDLRRQAGHREQDAARRSVGVIARLQHDRARMLFAADMARRRPICARRKLAASAIVFAWARLRLPRLPGLLSLPSRAAIKPRRAGAAGISPGNLNQVIKSRTQFFA